MTDSTSFNIKAVPSSVLIQRGRNAQRLSLDFWIESDDSNTWQLNYIGLNVFDRQNHCVLKRRLDRQALMPSIDVVQERTLLPHGSIYLFNPFPVFAADLDLYRLQFIFSFEREADQSMTLMTDVFPSVYDQKVDLRLPLKGRILVDDGHDDLSHHRRVVLNHPGAQAMGITSNDQRYAWDFILVNEAGKSYISNEDRLENFLSFGTPIYAPGDGTVVRVHNDVLDNQPYQVSYTEDDFGADPWLSSGNLVIIEHNGEEYSYLVHCQKGSILVNEGERIRQGQEIARLGNSGWSYTPHLHYQLSDNANLLGAGTELPAQFSLFALVVGSEMCLIQDGYPDTGEVIMAGPL